MRRTHFTILIILLIISESLYLLLYSHLAERLLLFIIISLVNSFLFILAWMVIRKESIPSSRKFLLALIVFGLVFRVSLIFLKPIASDDIYRYIWDGKVHAHGINPYRYSPDDTALEDLHSAVLPEKINFPHLKTIYPPFAEWVFLLSYQLFNESLVGFKALLLLAECATIFLLLLLLRELKLPQKYIALYLLCPLPVMQFMIDGHVDAIGFPFLLLFILLWLRGKRLHSYIALGISIISKLFPIIFLPVVMNLEKGGRKLFAGLIPIGILIAAYVPYFLWDGSPLESFGLFSMNWASNGSVFAVIYSLVRNNQTAHIIAATLLVVWLGYMAYSKNPFIEKIYLSVFCFFLFSSTVHPWYVTWLAVILPLNLRWSGIAFVVLVNLAQIPLIEYVATGVWNQPAWMLLLEYLPIMVLFMWELLSLFILSRYIPSTSRLPQIPIKRPILNRLTQMFRTNRS
ncbi:MAG: DUF2029 domain-containing protein [Ignavibacteriae bacterium]|nr:DUF2029 domain-containing protein [Ignavibacteriota bacterium]